MTESLAEVKPGDTVILVSRNGDSVKEVTVDRVGYKYLYLRGYDCSPTESFDLKTGRSRLDYGWPRRVFTPEGWMHQQRRDVAVELLRDRGVSLNHIALSTLSTEQVEKILAVVDPDA